MTDATQKIIDKKIEKIEEIETRLIHLLGPRPREIHNLAYTEQDSPVARLHWGWAWISSARYTVALMTIPRKRAHFARLTDDYLRRAAACCADGGRYESRNQI